MQDRKDKVKLTQYTQQKNIWMLAFKPRNKFGKHYIYAFKGHIYSDYFTCIVH